METSPRLVAALAVLAVLPVGIYAVGSGHLGGGLSAIGVFNVLLIAGSLVILFGPAGGNGHDHDRDRDNGTPG